MVEEEVSLRLESQLLVLLAHGVRQASQEGLCRSARRAIEDQDAFPVSVAYSNAASAHSRSPSGSGAVLPVLSESRLDEPLPTTDKALDRVCTVEIPRHALPFWRAVIDDLAASRPPSVLQALNDLHRERICLSRGESAREL